MSKKISVDLTDENAGALYQNKKVHGLGYGPTINMLIRIFFRSPDIRDDLIEICKSKIQSGNLECRNRITVWKNCVLKTGRSCRHRNRRLYL